MTYLNKQVTPGLILTLLFVSPLLYVDNLHDPSNLPRYIMLAFVSSSALFLFSCRLSNTNNKIYFPPAVSIAFAYLAWASVSSIWSVHSGNTIIYLVQLLCLFVVFFISVQISSIKTIKYIIYTSLIGASIAAYIGLLQNFGFNIFNLRGFTMGGTFTYKNHFALYLDLILPIGIVAILIAENKLKKWLSALALSICLAYVLSSHTRGSLLAIAGLSFFLIILLIFIPALRTNSINYFKASKLPLICSLLLAICIYAVPGINDRTLNRPAYHGDKMDTSSRDRLTAYHNAMYLFKDNALTGTGYGSFWKAFRPYMNHPKIIERSNETLYLFRLHSDPYQILVELGIIGGLLFLALFISIYIAAIKLILWNDNPERQIVTLALITAISACLVHSLVDFPFLKPSSAMQLWIYIGLISGLYARTNSKFSYVASSFTKNTAIVSSLIISLFMLVFYRAFFIESYNFRLAETALQEKNCPKSIQYIDKAVQEFPYNFYSHATRVQIHLFCNQDKAKLYEVLNNELAWDNTNVSALLARGDILLRSGYPAMAIRDFKDVAYLLPHRASGFLGEAQTLMAMKETDQADKILQKLKTEHPDNTRIEELLALLKQQKNLQ